jgi:uncharacterized protein
VIFEWDERKRQSNLFKHGLDFADCATVFAGKVWTGTDDRFDYAELRSLALGLLGERVVAVAYVAAGETLRVISMRQASRREQTAYFKSLVD